MTSELTDHHFDILRRTARGEWPTKHDMAMVRKAPHLRGQFGYTVFTAIAELLDAGYFEEPTWLAVQTAAIRKDRSPAVLTEDGLRVRESLL
jgi:hypothetical protein